MNKMIDCDTIRIIPDAFPRNKMLIFKSNLKEIYELFWNEWTESLAYINGQRSTFLSTCIITPLMELYKNNKLMRSYIFPSGADLSKFANFDYEVVDLNPKPEPEEYKVEATNNKKESFLKRFLCIFSCK